MQLSRAFTKIILLTGLSVWLIAGCIRMQPSVMIGAGDARMHLGDLDEFGAESRLGVEAFMAGDVIKAYKIWKPLADQGDAGAQNNLGHLYIGDTEGVIPHNPVMALKWYNKAAEQDHASAQFSIGVLHLTGKGVPKDDFEAFKWVRKSAEQGYEYAQYFLGEAYAYGWGEVIPQDDDEAIKWMRKAALQGNLEARGYLLMNSN
jgi:TPR repeat protein